MSTLSELFPAGGGDNTIDMVASGTLSNGSLVILKSDGTVEVAAGSVTSLSKSIPSGSEYSTGVYFESNAVSFDTQTADKFMIAYEDKDNSGYGTAVVGTVSGTTITFGTPAVFNSGSSPYMNVSAHLTTADKYIVACQAYTSTWRGIGVVLTVSGTTITVGTKTEFLSTYYCDNVQMALDPHNTDKFFVAYRDYTSGNKATLVVGTISGTSVSFGSNTRVSAGGGGGAPNICIGVDPNTANKVLVGYSDYAGATYDGFVHVCTISGTSVSAVGSSQTFTTANPGSPNIVFDKDTTNRVFFYWNQTTDNTARGRVATISGTSITFHTEYVVMAYQVSGINVAEDPNDSTKHIMVGRPYQGATDGYGVAWLISNSSNTLTIDSTHTFAAAETRNTSVSFDPSSAGKFVISYRDIDNSNDGSAIMGQLASSVTTTNLTSTNLLGVSQESASDGGTASIDTLGGVSDKLTGLTIGTDYYVATDGTLTTTAASNVSIGKAVNSTTINMRDYV